MYCFWLSHKAPYHNTAAAVTHQFARISGSLKSSVCTWELTGHPAQGDRWRTNLNLPTVQKYEAVCHIFQLWVPRLPQGVFDGEVLHVFLQRIVQGANLPVLPQSVQHQCREDFRQAGNPEGQITGQCDCVLYCSTCLLWCFPFHFKLFF